MQWIGRCLSSLAGSNHPTTVIVIDNGSTDETVEFVKINFRHVRVLETGKNLGFGQGNNIGLTIALENNADYVFLLNQDAWIQAATIDKLLAAHEQHREFGILSPLHLNGAGDELDRYFLDYLLRSDIRSFVQSFFLGQHSNSGIIDTPFVNAAAWLISRSCLVKTGGFDPVFFHYGEDDNYAHRALYHGYRIGVIPAAIVYHDKLYRDPQTSDIRKIFRHDWIIFLHQACDIRRKGYRRFAFRRFVRYTATALFSLCRLDKRLFYYNFQMAKNIPLSLPAIGKSRSINQRHTTAHLTVGKSQQAAYSMAG